MRWPWQKRIEELEQLAAAHIGHIATLEAQLVQATQERDAALAAAQVLRDKVREFLLKGAAALAGEEGR